MGETVLSANYYWGKTFFCFIGYKLYHNVTLTSDLNALCFINTLFHCAVCDFISILFQCAVSKTSDRMLCFSARLQKVWPDTLFQWAVWKASGWILRFSTQFTKPMTNYFVSVCSLQGVWLYSLCQCAVYEVSDYALSTLFKERSTAYFCFSEQLTKRPTKYFFFSAQFAKRVT